LVGLLALCVYILACTSFSPDDTKVLYPAFDGPSGAVGVAVYDREKGSSEMAFVPTMIGDNDANENTAKPALMRPQWMADGQRFLISWGGDNAPDGLTLAVMPWNARGPLRLFNFGKIEEHTLASPLCVAGDRVFLIESDNRILRLNVKTGEILRRDVGSGKPGDSKLVLPKTKITLLPDPNDQGVFYLEAHGEGTKTVFGRLNPDDLALSPLASFTNDLAEDSFFACDPERCAFLEKAQPLPQLVVLEDGRPVFRRPIGAKGEELNFASAVFSKRGDSLLAGFRRKRDGQPGASYGLMEIPLNDQPVRETVLISTSAAGDSGEAAFFEFGISHDGKTAAAASTYLACGDKDFKAGDCALFFIDLSDSNRKVTKVPIPLPKQRPAAGK